MPWILKLAVMVGLPLTMSAIAWLRHLSGAPRRDWHEAGVRYLVPPLTVIVAVLLISMEIQDPQVMQPDTYPPDIELFLVVGGVWAALVVWLVVEARRYRARHQELSYTQRLANRDKARKKRTRGQRRQRAL